MDALAADSLHGRAVCEAAPVLSVLVVVVPVSMSLCICVRLRLRMSVGVNVWRGMGRLRVSRGARRLGGCGPGGGGADATPAAVGQRRSGS